MLQLIFALTIFCSAFLIFLVQPTLAKIMLPIFGGSAFVWVTSVLFFQFGLLAGYVYAYLLCKLQSRWYQGVIHFFCITLSFCFIPLQLYTSNTLTSLWPPLSVLVMLMGSIFVPFALLSASTPLLQHWYCRIREVEFPYYYYAISNAGSLLGLLVYPFAIEYFLGVRLQTSMWGMLFLIYIVLLVICLISYTLKARKVNVDTEAASRVAKPLNKRKLTWLALSFSSCALLLSITQYLSQNVINLPLLWVITLALYLTTFIITFRKGFQYNPVFWGSCWLLSLLVLVFIPASGLGMVIVLLALLYCGCMVCHGGLVISAPKSQYLTEFYLSVAFGGVLGGVFTNLVSLMIFNDWWDFYLTILAITVIVARQYVIMTQSREECTDTGIMSYSKTIGIVLLGMILYQVYIVGRNQVVQVRNPYGLIKVVDTNKTRVLIHGRILHGVENTKVKQKRIPTAYFSTSTGLGVVIKYAQEKSDRISTGVIGLGIGTVAAYLRKEDRMHFYEIDSDIIKIAKRYFHYLSSSLGQVDMTLKDGRLALEQEWETTGSQDYDLLIVDAFSGDSIPFHLLTEEAVLLYQKHLKQNGIIAFHVTNTYVNLEAVTLALAERIGAQHFYLVNKPDVQTDTLESHWAILSHDVGLAHWLATQPIGDQTRAQTEVKPILWTDAKNSILPLLKLWESL